MPDLNPNMPSLPYPDLTVPPSAAAIVWLVQDLQPLLQVLILLLTCAFLGLGVALRWQLLHKMHGRHEKPENKLDHDLHM